MTNYSSQLKKVKAELKKLKLSLIILTIIDFLYLLWMFIDVGSWFIFSMFLYGLAIISILNLVLGVIFIWYLNGKFPSNGEDKTSQILMIFFLGVIGMWLWMPREKDLRHISN